RPRKMGVPRRARARVQGRLEDVHGRHLADAGVPRPGGRPGVRGVRRHSRSELLRPRHGRPTGDVGRPARVLPPRRELRLPSRDADPRHCRLAALARELAPRERARRDAGPRPGPRRSDAMTGGRVLVCDDWYPMDAVRRILPQAERCDVGGGGPGVAAILVSPDSPVTAADIGRMPDLRMIATASTGRDHIDTDAAAQAGIDVRDAGDYCAEEVADHALALLVALLRGVPGQDRSVQAGRFDHRAGGIPRRLAGTRLAVVGYGRIGRGLAARAEALGMD